MSKANLFQRKHSYESAIGLRLTVCNIWDSRNQALRTLSVPDGLSFEEDSGLAICFMKSGGYH